MEVIYSFETLVDFKQTTQRYMLEVITLHNHHSEDLKPYTVHIVSEVKLIFNTIASIKCQLFGKVQGKKTVINMEKFDQIVL
jgi:hypothetical protein